MTILGPDPQRRRNQHRIVIAALIAALHVTDDLPLHANHLSSRIQRRSSALRALNRPKLPTRYPLRKLLSHLAVGSLPHTPIYRCLQNCSFVLNSRALEDVVARICH